MAESTRNEKIKAIQEIHDKWFMTVGFSIGQFKNLIDILKKVHNKKVQNITISKGYQIVWLDDDTIITNISELESCCGFRAGRLIVNKNAITKENYDIFKNNVLQCYFGGDEDIVWIDADELMEELQNEEKEE